MIATPSSASLQVQDPATISPPTTVTPVKVASSENTSPTKDAENDSQDTRDDSHTPQPGPEARNPVKELAVAREFLATIRNGNPLTHLAIVQDAAFRGGLILMLASPLAETVLVALQTLLLLAQSPDPRVFAPIRAELAFRTAMSHFLSEPGIDPHVRELALVLAKRPADASVSGLRVVVGACGVSPTKRATAPSACSPTATSSSSSNASSTRCVAGWPAASSGARTGSPRRMASVNRLNGAGYASRAPSTARSIFTPTRSRALHIALLHPRVDHVSDRLHTAMTRTLLGTPGIISFTIEVPTTAGSTAQRPRMVLRVVPTIQPDDLLQHLVRKIPALVKQLRDEARDEGHDADDQEGAEAAEGITLAVVIPARRADGAETVLPAVRTPEPELDEEAEEAEEEEDASDSDDDADDEEDDDDDADEDEEEDDPYADATKRTAANKRALSAPGYLDDNGMDPFAHDDEADDKDNTAKVVPKGWLGKVSSWLGW